MNFLVYFFNSFDNFFFAVEINLKKGSLGGFFWYEDPLFLKMRGKKCEKKKIFGVGCGFKFESLKWREMKKGTVKRL